MACESTHLILVLTSCLANSSVSTFLFWCSPKPSSDIKLPLQLVPPAPPPHQVSNSIPVSRESFARSIFLLCHFLSNLSIATFQIYYHSLFSFNSIHYLSAPLLLDLSGLYHPSVLNFLCFSVISSQRPSPILSTLLSCLILAVCSALLPPSPNARSLLVSPGPGLHPTSTSSAPTLVLCEHGWQGSSR